MGSQPPEQPTPPPTKSLRIAVRLIGVLLSLAIAQGAVLAWLVFRAPSSAQTARGDQVGFRASDANLVRSAYPNVDFTRIYPGWSPDDIELVQRESYSVRYAYEPFVQFRAVAVKQRFVEVTAAGYRAGLAPQSWPPDADDYVVFVFGGSTTFSYGLPNDHTVVALLQKEWSARNPDLRLQLYNFGSGFYFSTQERVLFESLLLDGIVPDAAVFIDGINDFAFSDGRPQFTPLLHHAVAPDLPYPREPAPRSADEVTRLVESVLSRYQRNLQLISIVAGPHGVRLIFVGQPSPFLDYPRNEATYPFRRPFVGHELAAIGYPRFKQLADAGGFGSNFVWCGDAFKEARSSMYADGIHYSLAGAEAFASAIVERAGAQQLLP